MLYLLILVVAAFFFIYTLGWVGILGLFLYWVLLQLLLLS